MAIRETLLGEYKENLEIIEDSEAQKGEAGDDLEKARAKWDDAQQLWQARTEKQDAAIAAARAEIVQCRIGLQMNCPKTGTDLPPELDDATPPSVTFGDKWLEDEGEGPEPKLIGEQAALGEEAT